MCLPPPVHALAAVVRHWVRGIGVRRWGRRLARARHVLEGQALARSCRNGRWLS